MPPAHEKLSCSVFCMLPPQRAREWRCNICPAQLTPALPAVKPPHSSPHHALVPLPHQRLARRGRRAARRLERRRLARQLAHAAERSAVLGQGRRIDLRRGPSGEGERAGGWRGGEEGDGPDAGLPTSLQVFMRRKGAPTSTGVAAGVVQQPAPPCCRGGLLQAGAPACQQQLCTAPRIYSFKGLCLYWPAGGPPRQGTLPPNHG